FAVSDKPDLYRITKPDASRIGVDLDAPCGPRLGIKLDVWERAANNQQRVAGLNRILGWPGAEQADAAGSVWARIRNGGFSKQRLDNWRGERLGQLFQLIGGVKRAGSCQNGNLCSGIQHFGGAPQVLLFGHPTAYCKHIGGVMRLITR